MWSLPTRWADGPSFSIGKRGRGCFGKDFVSGFIGTCLFLRCLKEGKQCRIVTTSVSEDHLRVLWAEIARFVATCKHPLLANKGGPLVMNHMEIKLQREAGEKNPQSYFIGKVSAKGEGLSGHHAERTLVIGDEASGIDDLVYSMVQQWAKRQLWIGNPNDSAAFYKRNIKAGDLLAPDEPTLIGVQ